MSRPRPVHRETCRDCGQAVLVGLDADRAGIPVSLDPDPIDGVGEVLALLAGRQTFELETARADRGAVVGRQMQPRGPARIRDSRTVLRRPVHAEHRCGQPLPAAAIPAADPTWPEEARF